MKKLLAILMMMTTAMTATMGQDNPLLGAWNTPHQTPPFSQIRNEHYRPAMRAAIKEAKANIDRIAKQKEAPTFENTIVAMENASRTLDRVSGVLFNLNECNTDSVMQQIVMELTPELTRFENSVTMDDRLFARVKAVYDNRATLQLTQEQTMLLEKCYKRFIRHGALLDKKDRKTFGKNAEELAQLSQQFNQNVLADNNEFTLQITQKENLAGLPDNVVPYAVVPIGYPAGENQPKDKWDTTRIHYDRW